MYKDIFLKTIPASKSPYAIGTLIAFSTLLWKISDNLTANLIITILIGISQWLSIAYGHLALTYFHQAENRSDLDIDALVIGNIFLGSALSIVVYFLKLNVIYAFSFLLLVYPLAAYFFQKSDVKPSRSMATSSQNLIVIAFAIAIVSLIEIDALSSPIKEVDLITFKPWTDYFIHTANAIMMTGENIMAGRYEAAGEAASFYHYGSYMLPALIIQTGLADALSIMTSFWATLGGVLAFIALFSLSKFIWGWQTGILAVTTLLLLPDASHQLFEHSYFGFQWLLQTSPGCYWGVALFAIGLRFLLEGLTTRQNKLIILAFSLIALMPLIRAQFSILTFELFVIVSMIYYPHLKIRYRILGTAVGMLLIFGLTQLIGPHIYNPTLSGPSGGKEFLTTFLNPAFTSNFYGLKTLIPTIVEGSGSSILASIFIIIFVTGFGFVLYPASVLISKLHNKPLRYSSIPLIFSFLYTAYIWHMPVNSGGNPFEMTHRPFVLIYSLVGLWVSGQLFTAAKYYVVDRLSGKQIYTAVLSVFILLITLHLLQAPASERYGRESYLNTQYSRGLYDVSRKVRELGSRSDRFLDSGFDPGNFIIAVSETRSYLSRHKRRSIQLRKKRAELYGQLKKNADFMLSTNNLQEVKAIAKMQNLRWIIKRPEHSIPWTEHVKTSYSNQGYELYDLDDI